MAANSVNHYPAYGTAGTFVPDNLLAGDFPLKTKTITLKAGTSYTRGMVLEEGASADVGKFLLVTTDANAKYVLLEDMDATAADKKATVAITGEFNSNALTLGSGATKAGITKALEPLSIFVRDAVA